MAHLLNPNAALTQPTDPSAKPNDSLTGTYFLRVREVSTRCGGTYHVATVSRQVPFATLGFRLLTSARAATAAEAVREARRNVRNARKAGGL